MKSSIDIGVDVSQTTLYIAVEGVPGVLKIANAAAAILRWLCTLPEGCRIAV